MNTNFKFFLSSILFITFCGCNNKHNCLEQPVNKLSNTQFQWFYSANKLSNYISNNGDTIQCRMGVMELLTNSGQAPKDCPHSPIVSEYVRQPIIFNKMLGSNIYLEMSFYDVNYPHFIFGAKAINIGTKVNKKVLINGLEYSDVVKCYRSYDQLSNIPDTIYFSKADGILKLTFVKNNLIVEKI